MIEVFCCHNGRYMTNCYLVRETVSDMTAAIDCASYDEDYKAFLASHNAGKPDYMIATHGHFDHVVGIGRMKRDTGAKVFIHEAEKNCLNDEFENLNAYNEHFPGFEPCEADVLLKDGDEIPFGNTVIKVMHTPGHTTGCICLVVGEHLFSGDTLFRLSMGRTDLPGGDLYKIRASLGALAGIEEDYIVYPGHGETTTLSFEKQFNRYMCDVQ